MHKTHPGGRRGEARSRACADRRPPPGPESEKAARSTALQEYQEPCLGLSMERVAVEVDAEDPCASDDETQLIEGEEDDEEYRMPERYGRRRLPRDAVVLPGAGEAALRRASGDDELGIFMSSSSVPHVHPVDVQSFCALFPRAGLC